MIGGYITRGIVLVGSQPRIGGADGELATQAVILVACQLFIGVDDGEQLADGVVVERGLHVLAVGVADGLAVAPANGKSGQVPTQVHIARWF